MADPMYPEEDDQTTADSTGQESSSDNTQGDDESAEGETFLVPKSAIGDYKVGDTCTFKVVHLYQDEAELAPVEDEAKEMNEGDQGSMPEAMSALEGMASKA